MLSYIVIKKDGANTLKGQINTLGNGIAGTISSSPSTKMHKLLFIDTKITMLS